jgi:heat shock protein HslJ
MMMRYRWIIGLGLAGAMGLAGCASTKTATEPPSLDGSSWVLASLPGRSLVPDATPTARFGGGHVAGTDGCNRYAMPFTVQGSEIRIGPKGPSTLMACPEVTMAQAEAFTSALTGARGFRHGEGTLDLLDAHGTAVATLVTQAHALPGTSWNVVNINNGRQAVVGLAADSTLTMAFDTAGGVSGSTGCNRYTAAYRAEGDTLHLSSVAATRLACADEALAEQERAFLSALESVATLSFEGDRLDLRGPDGALAVILERKR